MKTLISTGKGSKPKGELYNVSDVEAEHLLKAGFGVEAEKEKKKTEKITKED